MNHPNEIENITVILLKCVSHLKSFWSERCAACNHILYAAEHLSPLQKLFNAIFLSAATQSLFHSPFSRKYIKWLSITKLHLIFCNFHQPKKSEKNKEDVFLFYIFILMSCIWWHMCMNKLETYEQYHFWDGLWNFELATNEICLEKFAMTQSQRCHFSWNGKCREKNTRLMENSHSSQTFAGNIHLKHVSFRPPFVPLVVAKKKWKWNALNVNFVKCEKNGIYFTERERKAAVAAIEALKWCLHKVKVKIGAGYSFCQCRSFVRSIDYFLFFLLLNIEQNFNFE